MYNRFRTAILRNTLSRPTRILLEKGLLYGDIIDIGCGYGSCVDILKRDYGLNTYGYDKFNEFYNEQKLLKNKYDVVMCHYVFNVIEDLQEHDGLIGLLRSLSDNVYISVRSDYKAIKDSWEYDSKAQGYWTSIGTFQRFYNDVMIDILFDGKEEYIINDNSMKLFRLRK